MSLRVLDTVLQLLAFRLEDVNFGFEALSFFDQLVDIETGGWDRLVEIGPLMFGVGVGGD